MRYPFRDKPKLLAGERDLLIERMTVREVDALSEEERKHYLLAREDIAVRYTNFDD
jgi:hypothetical protein